MTDSTPASRAAGKSRLLPVVLVGSLAVNLLLAGVIAGRVFSPAPPFHPFGRGPESMAHFQPSPAVREMRESMRRQRPEMAEQGRALREARNKVREILSAEPFDKASLEQALAEVRRRSQTMQETMHAALAENAAKLPPDARARLLPMERPRPPHRS